MSSQSPSGRPAATGPEPDVEQEVELGRLWWAIVARWWLVVLCVVLGVLVGYLVSLGGGRVFQGKATVYLGQPLSPTGNSQVQTLATNPSSVSQIVKSERVIQSVAHELGIPADELRRGVSTKVVAGTTAKSAPTSLVEVIVRGPWKRQSAEAANALAQTVVDEVSTYPDAKIEKLELVLDGLDDQLAALESAIAEYEAQLGASSELDPAARLAVVGLLNSAVVHRGELRVERNTAALDLTLAQEVERGRVLTQAAAAKVAARGRQSSMIVGAVIGLLLGIVLALAWEPVRRRFASERES